MCAVNLQIFLRNIFVLYLHVALSITAIHSLCCYYLYLHIELSSAQTDPALPTQHAFHSLCCGLRLKCDGTRAETRFRLSVKRTSPFKSAGASVQSTTDSTSAVVMVTMLGTPCSDVVWRVLATHSIRHFAPHFPSRASPCAITFQLDCNYWQLRLLTYITTELEAFRVYGYQTLSCDFCGAGTDSYRVSIPDWSSVGETTRPAVSLMLPSKILFGL